MSRPRATSNRCVISQPVRRITDAEATGTNQFDATGIFCGKLLHCPVSVLTGAPSSTKSPENRWLSSLSTVKRCPGWLSCEGRHRLGRTQSCRFSVTEVPEIPAETKDPSGGTTGRVKLYGRLGWMGARAEYSLDGEGLPLPLKLVAAGVRHVQNLRRFFTLLAGVFGVNTKA